MLTLGFEFAIAVAVLFSIGFYITLQVAKKFSDDSIKELEVSIIGIIITAMISFYGPLTAYLVYSLCS